jgi:very-short-patch-repair endonuclease
VACYDQLRSEGLSGRAIRAAVRDGRLVPIGRFVVADPSWQARVVEGPSVLWRRELWAALLSLSPRQRAMAVAYRRSAAVLWGLDGVPAGVVELGTEFGRPQSPLVHRVRALGPNERCHLDGMPVTSATRTLVDLGQVCDVGTIERATEAALRKRHVTVAQLLAALDLVPHQPGTGALRRLLGTRPAGTPPTESDAETLFLQVVRLAGLPEPVRQYVVPTAELNARIDFAWPRQRLGVEIDGAATHGSPDALARDLRRQNRLLLTLVPTGWIMLRFTWQDLTDPRYTGQTVARLREAWALGCRVSIST